MKKLLILLLIFIVLISGCTQPTGEFLAEQKAKALEDARNTLDACYAKCSGRLENYCRNACEFAYNHTIKKIEEQFGE